MHSWAPRERISKIIKSQDFEHHVYHTESFGEEFILFVAILDAVNILECQTILHVMYNIEKCNDN